VLCRRVRELCTGCAADGAAFTCGESAYNLNAESYLTVRGQSVVCFAPLTANHIFDDGPRLICV